VVTSTAFFYKADALKNKVEQVQELSKKQAYLLARALLARGDHYAELL
jgi:hypothetical protein